MSRGKIIFSVIGAVLLLSLIFIFFISPTTLSVQVSGQNMKVDIEGDLSGHQVEIEANVDGSIRGGDKVVSPFTGNTATVSVCGSNDGDTAIGVSHSSVGNKFRVKINSTSDFRGCENSIKGKVTLPKGTLSVTCSLNAPIGSGETLSKCNVEGAERSILTARSGVADSPKSENKLYKFIIEDEETIDFELTTLARGSTPTAELIFIFDEVECSIDAQCESTLGEKFCSNGDIMQKVNEGRCLNEECGSVSSSKLFRECELGCEEVDGQVSCEEGVPLVQDWRFWVGLLVVLLIAGLIIFFLLKR